MSTKMRVSPAIEADDNDRRRALKTTLTAGALVGAGDNSRYRTGALLGKPRRRCRQAARRQLTMHAQRAQYSQSR